MENWFLFSRLPTYGASTAVSVNFLINKHEERGSEEKEEVVVWTWKQKRQKQSHKLNSTLKLSHWIRWGEFANLMSLLMIK